jgi:hypothetical protein
MPVDVTGVGGHDGARHAARRNSANGRRPPRTELTNQEPDMDVVRRSDFKDLVTGVTPPCVSIYVPTHQRGRDIEQDPIRLRKLLNDARGDLADIGLRSAETDALLAPATRLVDDTRFWQHQKQGLAILLAPERSEVLRVPVTVPELIVVGDRFHLHPLVHLLDADERVHVLALSQQRAQLFEADRFTITPIDVDGLPQGVDDLFDDPDNQHTTQLRRASAGPSDAAFVHGHGGAKDLSDDRRIQYLRTVDRALQPVLPEGARLVVAGVHNVVAEFRSVSALDVVGEISGQSDRVTPTELLEALWQVVTPAIDEERARDLDRLGEQLASGRAIDDLTGVVGAAQQGRVETLFVVPATELDVTDDVRALVDDAVVHTVLHGGGVHLVGGDRVPTPTAVLRY